jgi:octaprenyl-diphosphate synthase
MVLHRVPAPSPLDTSPPLPPYGSVEAVPPHEHRMNSIIELPEELIPLAGFVAESLVKVQRIFDDHLRSDLPPVSKLCRHVERYRGKMLRPSLVLLSGLAAHPDAAADNSILIRKAHLVVAAVCEMVHMATLVHDDVLDEADTRRRGETINRLHGNEAAVILGDYLIASAYHLCSGLAEPRAALAIGRASMVMCAGELLQLHHRDDYSVDEPTYFEIVERKTAELIATAAELGAAQSGATEDVCSRMALFGRRLGVAFQIQDDLLDILGEAEKVGKPVGKDLEKGKMTLPIIHHLANADPAIRAQTLLALESGSDVLAALEGTGSIEYARATAERYVNEARDAIDPLPEAPAKRMLLTMAEAVIKRDF